jgi:hypothetical protein
VVQTFGSELTQLQPSRKNDFVLRQEVKATKKDVADAQASAKATISDLQQHVLASSHTIEQGVQQASVAIESSKQANSTSFLKVKESLASASATVIGINAAIEGQAKTVHRSLSSVKKRLASGRREQDALLRC